MAGAYGNLYLSTTEGQLCCISGDGEDLDAMSEVEIEELNENSAPPSPPKRRAKKPAPKAKTIRLPSKDGDFAKLDQARAYQTELGYRVASQQAGMVLKSLDAPLTGKVTLKCKLQYANGDGATNNGYLAFGGSSNEAQLVKCGLRHKMETAAIIQGSLSANEGETTPCVTDYGKQYELIVTVDLQSGNVTFQAGGKKVNAKLEQPMKSITHVGYCLNNTITDFSPIEASAAQ
jgi:hypothetical protein